MPMVFLGERPYSGSVGHILLGDARIGGENQIEGARIMTAFYSYMVDQPAILDRIGASADGFVFLERICGQKERDESVGRRQLRGRR